MIHVMWKVWILLLLSSCVGIGHSDDKDSVKNTRAKRQFIFGRVHSEETPCMDFCAYAGICSYRGRCETNHTTCEPFCFCDDGFAGMWCTEVIVTQTSRETSVIQDHTTKSVTVTEPANSATTEERDSPGMSSAITNSLPVTTHPTTIHVANRLFSHVLFPPSSSTELPSLLLSTSAPQVNSIDYTSYEATTTSEPYASKTSTAPLNQSAVPILQSTTSSAIDTLASITTTTDVSTIYLHKEDDHHSHHEDDDDTCQGTCIPPNECELVDGVVECVVHNHSDCFEGFPCVHGQCNKDGLTNGTGSLHCNCERNWIGTFCATRCDLSCNDHGYCTQLHHNVTIVCVCDREYTGEFCEKRKPVPIEVEEDWHWYVAGTCSVIAVILLAVLITLPYMLWKRRFVFIMKIVYYFQQYEEDDGKEFDAFVSYKSSKEDEHFVVHTLYPVLEKSFNFKLCLHFRDFMVGETIANNIISAIENSRRTIMVLSPNYIESEWCRMEYQKAQHEMLKLKHKIIPLILEDISSCEIQDANLKTILNSVTYLNWPGEDNPKKLERFWKQLELVMPKKKFVPPIPLMSSASITSTATEMTDISSSEFIMNAINDRSSFSSLGNVSVSDVSLQKVAEMKKGERVLSQISHDVVVDVGDSNVNFSDSSSPMGSNVEPSPCVEKNQSDNRCTSDPSRDLSDASILSSAIDMNYEDSAQTTDVIPISVPSVRSTTELCSFVSNTCDGTSLTSASTTLPQTELMQQNNSDIYRLNDIQSCRLEIAGENTNKEISDVAGDKEEFCFQMNVRKITPAKGNSRSVVNVLEAV